MPCPRGWHNGSEGGGEHLLHKPKGLSFAAISRAPVKKQMLYPCASVSPALLWQDRKVKARTSGSAWAS